jgi:nucleoside-triphosphatase THEP1
MTEKNTDNTIYYRLISIWVICEAMLGGIIHGLKIPVSGLLVGSCAVACISLIGWYVPVRGAILKATLIVAIFKMMLSPQAPLPAYFAVFFQGLLGEILFSSRRFYRLSCYLLAILSLLESGLQRIIVLTIVYGNDLWKAINDFINKLTGQASLTNYSLLIAEIYVSVHLLTGILLGYWLSGLPRRLEKWKTSESISIDIQPVNAALPVVKKRKRKLKKALLVIWIILVLLYAQSYFKIGDPLLPSSLPLRIFIRSVIIVLAWIFIVSPLLTSWLHSWLRKKQSKTRTELEKVVGLLPATEALIRQCWQATNGLGGWKRLGRFSRLLLVNNLHSSPVGSSPNKNIFILTGPIGSGKTTALINWSANRSDVYGILTPVKNGKRYFRDIHGGEEFPMEAAYEETRRLEIGKYVFSEEMFEKAIEIIRKGSKKGGWLVIDEIGPMEMKGIGFAGILREILITRKCRLLIVVREGMAEKVKESFGIGEATNIQSSQLPGLE